MIRLQLAFKSTDSIKFLSMSFDAFLKSKSVEFMFSAMQLLF